MTNVAIKDRTAASNWESLSLTRKAAGYAVAEAESRFPQERLAEHALRIAGALVILAGYLQWFLQGVVLPEMTVRLTLFLTVVFVGTGILLYRFASRGFRRVLQVDMGGRALSVMRVNSKGRGLNGRRFVMEDIGSIFVSRSHDSTALATLNIRTHAEYGFVLLAGDPAELQALHARLCDDIKTAMGGGQRRVTQHKVSVGRKRLFRGGGADVSPSAFAAQTTP